MVCSSELALQLVKMPKRPGKPQCKDLGVPVQRPGWGSQLASSRAMRHGNRESSSRACSMMARAMRGDTSLRQGLTYLRMTQKP